MNGPKIAQAMEPLLVQHGVDLFVAGHLHNFERSWPVLNQSVVRHNYSWNGTGAQGMVHVVAGMAGDDEGLTDRWEDPAPAWSAFRTAKLGWLRLSFHNAVELTVDFIASVGGEVLDTFVLRKPGSV
jgi:acid phosphatase